MGNIGKGMTEAYCLSNKGMMEVHIGDWVVKELDGTFYSVPDEIFKAKYEPVK